MKAIATDLDFVGCSLIPLVTSNPKDTGLHSELLVKLVSRVFWFFALPFPLRRGKHRCGWCWGPNEWEAIKKWRNLDMNSFSLFRWRFPMKAMLSTSDTVPSHHCYCFPRMYIERCNMWLVHKSVMLSWDECLLIVLVKAFSFGSWLSCCIDTIN